MWIQHWQVTRLSTNDQSVCRICDGRRATLDRGRIVIRPLCNMMPSAPTREKTLPSFPMPKLDSVDDNGTPATPFRSHGRSRGLLNGYLQPKTDAIECVRMVCIWFSAPPESAVGGFSAKGAWNSVSERNPFGLRDRRARQHVCRYNFVRAMRGAVLCYDPRIRLDGGI